MFLTLLVKYLGGVWELKRLIERKTDGLIKKILLKVYTCFLEQKGSFIGLNSRFANIPIFPHGISGIFISSSAVIGKDCVLFHQVTIGSNALPDSKYLGAPIVGDNVYIGCGAKLIGNIKIGDNCRIGANCVVVESVPENSVVVMNKPRIIKKHDLNNKYYSLTKKGLSYMENGEWMEVKNQDVIKAFKNIKG